MAFVRLDFASAVCFFHMLLILKEKQIMLTNILDCKRKEF